MIGKLAAMLRERAELRLFLVANALWELTLAALKTFVVLYITKGMGLSLSTSSGIIAAVSLLIIVASPVSGKLGDRFGKARVMRWACTVYGLGFLIPFLITNKIVVAVSVPFIAFGGGVVMTLPYALLTPLMDEEEHGALTGYYSFSRGIGIALGPVIAGAAIGATASSSFFGATHGYQAMWGVCAVAALLSIWPLTALRRRIGDEED